MMNLCGEELRSFHIDFERRIFRINGEDVPFCTEFLLKGYIGKDGPAMLLELKLEPQFTHKYSGTELKELQMSCECG